MKKQDKTQLEVMARMGVGALLGNILTIAYLPEIVPPSQKGFLAAMSAVFVVVMPRFVFAIGYSLPLNLVYLILALLGATALLASATVSNGLLTAMFFVYTLLSTSFYFGSTETELSAGVTMLIAMTALMTTSLRLLVQEGLTFSTSLSDVSDDLLLEELQAAVCDNTNCSSPELYSNVTLPSDLPYAFAGQTVLVSIAHGTLTGHIEGGLWLVKAFWTEQGTTNPLAVFRNFLIAACWSMLCGIVTVIIPPIRTMRQTLSCMIVPGAIAQCVQILVQWEHKQTNVSKEQVEKYVHTWNTIAGGDQAKLIVFEPRICYPFEYIVPELKQLLSRTDLMVNECLVYAVETSKPEGMDEGITKEDKAEAIDKAVGILKSTAKALQSDSPESIEGCEQLESKEPPGNVKLHWQPVIIYDHSESLAASAISWLNVLNTHSRDSHSTKNLLKTFVSWLYLPFQPLMRLQQVLQLLFQPNKWWIGCVVWSLKLTAGYVALFAMDVYWKSFSNFAIQNTSTPIEDGIYSGWVFLAYSFTWLPTIEGTFKKGVQRLAGTCLGGFAGWLGIIVASGSYDDNADINPYGLIAWMTALTFVTCYFTVEPGFMGLMGSSRNQGFAGMYFAMTLNLISVEVYMGTGSKSDVTLNRIASNLTGIAMAVLLNMLPPWGKLGGSTEHTSNYSVALNDAFSTLVKMLMDEQSSFDLDTISVHLRRAKALRRKAIFLYNDAARLDVLPFLKVDHRLLNVLEGLNMAESMIARLASYCSDVAETEDSEVWSAVSRVISETIKRNDDGDGWSLVQYQDSPSVRLARLVTWIRAINGSLIKEEGILDDLARQHRLRSWSLYSLKDRLEERPLSSLRDRYKCNK